MKIEIQMTFMYKLLYEDGWQMLAFEYYTIIIQNMNAIFDSQRFSKLIIISILFLITFLIIGVIKLITGSVIAGIILYLGLIWYLLKQVGSFVMYPGSFFYSRSDIQMRYSRELGSRMINCFNAFHQLFICISQKRYSNFQAFIDYNAAVQRHLKSIITTLQMFEDTLSQRKIILLRLYRQIERLIEEKQEERPSISDFFNRPRAIAGIQQRDQHFYGLRMAQINSIIKEIIQIIKSYTPPSGAIDRIKFRAFQQNLYEIRFGFSNWKMLYEYQLFHVPTTNSASLQSAIIHKRKVYFNEQDTGPNTSKKAILFCNPNGVFIQFFGVDNEYIANYLKQGYHMILWNYRGYGQSTGQPSIERSQQDAYSIYKFYRNKGYEIEIVHGYSIGGPAAVGLMQHISKNQVRNPNDIVKILIVDRSFSSIGEIAVQFGQTLSTLAKIVLFRDNIDISHGFQQAKCRKLLIWDYSDEVIPDKASVKNKIMKRKKQTDKKNQQRGLLNQDVQSYQLQQTTLQIQIQSLSKKLCANLEKVVKKHKNANNSDKQLNFMTEQHRQSSLSTQAVQDSNYQHLIKIIGKVDGGGIDLFHNINQLQHILSHKCEYFYHICQSYILGLIFYGSYFPLRPIIQNNRQMKEQTLNKIKTLLKDISERYEIDQQNIELSYSSTDETIPQIHKNIYFIYFRIVQIIQECCGEEWFRVHGSLLPANNGHNNPLNELEFRVLNQFIRSSLEYHQEGLKRQ